MEPSMITSTTFLFTHTPAMHWYEGMKLDPRVNHVLSERNEMRHNDLRAKLIAGVFCVSLLH